MPRLVVVVEDESEVRRLLATCRRHGASVTFRGSGTSLSGQAVTDGVLAVMGDGWRQLRILEGGAAVAMGPAVLGGEANQQLAALGRRLGPDPASLHVATLGGMAANNSSGMCCGTAQNCYRTLRSLRLVLADGTRVDTGDPTSRAALAASHPALLEGLRGLRAEVLADSALTARIRRKFAIKNTTGYSLEALLDFEDPVDILAHLMIGSEGTLGFLAEITLETVPDPRHQATALACYPDAARAARAVQAVAAAPVAAVELIDDRGLRAFAGRPGTPAVLADLPAGATALLLEVQAEGAEELAAAVAATTASLAATPSLAPFEFTTDPGARAALWQIRKGLFPLVGAHRPDGSTVLIEDVAFPMEHLADGVVGLRELLASHGYRDGIVFGHALAGNLHFVFAQSFDSPAQVARYGAFMEDLVALVVDRFDGSLKAEHGTGRNMAPFVEREWGAQAYSLMLRIKQLLDPDEVLNRGVVLNPDPSLHLKDLKPMPAADAGIDRCTECGFCEPVCPSKGLTLSPRQRIVSWRDRPGGAIDDAFRYQGLDTCAACSLCALACPLDIDTGDLIRRLRARDRGGGARRAAGWVAGHMATTLAATRLGWKAAGFARGLLGAARMQALADGARRWLPGAPAWRDTLPTAPGPAPEVAGPPEPGTPVVYMPGCPARSMGPTAGDPRQEPLPQVVTRLLRRAGFRVVLPEGLDELCCGLPFTSKGFPEAAEGKRVQMAAALARASSGGAFPVVTDTSPCGLASGGSALDLTDFLHDQVLPRLVVTRRQGRVALHVTCSGQRLGNGGKLRALVEACAAEVVVPRGIHCCGFAGDKGFFVPELGEFALRDLRRQVRELADEGCSSSRTCEIGLAEAAGIPYRSVAYLLERATRPA